MSAVVADGKTGIELDHIQVRPHSTVDLDARPTDDTFGFDGKRDTAELAEDLRARLDGLHNRLWAEAKRSLVLVLQGLDASGKDGTIRRVLSGLNPQGCSVVSFKAPVGDELAHDYLWRVHRHMPARGLLGVMNRSHYEDVLAARIAGTVDDDRCRLRYRHLREFERMLFDEGTTIVKVYLHISKDEQRRRLQERIDDPAKNWKFDRMDLEARERWGEYRAAYEETLAATSTGWAPWQVVPADRKWVRDLLVSTLLVDALERMDPQVPAPEPGLEGLIVP